MAAGLLLIGERGAGVAAPLDRTGKIDQLPACAARGLRSHDLLEVNDPHGRAQTRPSKLSRSFQGEAFTHEHRSISRPRNTSEPCNSHPLDAKPWQNVRDRGHHDRKLVKVFVTIEMRDRNSGIAHARDLCCDFRFDFPQGQPTGDRSEKQLLLAVKLTVRSGERAAAVSGAPSHRFR